MNSANQFLTLHARLLIAEYGRKRVIGAIAQAENVEVENIEQDINSAKEKRSRKPRRPKSVSQLLKDAEIDSHICSIVEQLACAYQNKRYLSELWRVRRFLDSKGVDATRFASRTAAFPLVVKVLGNLPEKELSEILSGLHESEKGDLGIIADQILGASNRESRTANETA